MIGASGSRVVAAGNEGIEGGEQLLTVDVGFLQDFVTGTVDHQQRTEPPTRFAS